MPTKKQARQARALLAVFEEQRAAKAERKGKGGKVRKTTTSRRKVETRTVNFDGTVPGHRCLIRKNREMFIADHDWATVSSESTSSLHRRVVVDGEKLVGTWAVSAKAVAKVLEIDEANAKPITPASQGGKTKRSSGPKKGKAERKGKKKAKAAKKVEAEPVEVVEVIDVPEWGSKEWIATTHPREKDTPRNGKGQPTARKEWPIRIELEATGKYDRNEVDAKIQDAYDAGLIEA